MSVPPSFMQQLMAGLQNGMQNPLLTNGLGIMSAAGPSRMPVSLGGALAGGMQQGQQLQQGQLANAMQQLMMGQTLAKMNYMMNPPSQQAQQNPSSDQSQQPSVDSQQANPFINPSMPPQQIANALLGKQPVQNASASPNSIDTTKMSPQQMVTAPSTVSDPMEDPYYKYLAGGARMGLQGWEALAGQRQQFLLAEPSFQAAQERAKSFAGLQNVRQGGAVFDPVSGQVLFQNPHLPVGGILNPDRSVSLAPGSLPAISQSEQASAQGSLFGKPATGVITSGPQTGGQYQSTVGQLTNGGRGPGAITALPPAQEAGMPEAGKAATERANTAIEQQKAAQQTIGQLGQLQANLEALGTGPGKETQLEVKKALASVGGFLGFPGLANADLTNAAAARKSIVNLTAPMVRAMGAREPFQMVNFIRDGMASIPNTQDANGVVLGMLRGIAEYQNDTGKYAGSWLNSNNGAGFAPGQGAWDANWQKQADPGAYIFDNLPPFEQQSIINAAQKNPSLLAELQRMAKSKKVLTSQGFMLQEGQ